MKAYATAVCLAMAGALCANPQNPTVIEGEVSFGGSGSLLNVTSESNRSIVEWESFSIGSAQTSHFDLPNASSAILNRVVSENISDLRGELTSNGQVYLINPYGIYIHDNAVVSTAAFLASTMDTSNQEFLDGDLMTFTTTDNPDIFLINDGTIETSLGDAALLGFQVIQRGEIDGNGMAALGAGLEIVFQPNNDPKIAIVASVGTPASTGVDLQGAVRALRAEIKADGNLYQYAINMDNGELDCSASYSSFARFEAPDGLVYVNATISCSDNTGSYGGVIDVLGETIDIAGSAVLDASGLAGGGEVYVGGGWGGSDPDRFNAETTLVQTGALIDCSAGLVGNGGVSVLWADDTAEFYGTIDAKAGILGGNGGEVEVSGIEQLDFYGTVDISSLFGDPGTLTIDPKTLHYDPTPRDGYTQATPVIRDPDQMRD